MSRLTPWLLLVFIGLSIALGLDVWKLNRNLLRVSAESEAAKAASQQRLATLTRKLASAEKIRSETDRARKVKTDPSAPGFVPPPPRRGAGEQMMRNPVFIALMHRQHQRNVESDYADLLATLHLPADKLAKLKKLLVDSLETASDVRMAAGDVGMTDPQSLAQASKQAADEINQEEAALLGDADYAKFRELASFQGPLRGVRQQYMPDLAYAGVPLSSDQSIALAHVVHDLWDAKTNPDLSQMKTQVVDPETGYTVIDQELINRSANLLSPEQAAVIKSDQITFRKQAMFFQNLSKQATGPTVVVRSEQSP